MMTWLEYNTVMGSILAAIRPHDGWPEIDVSYAWSNHTCLVVYINIQLSVTQITEQIFIVFSSYVTDNTMRRKESDRQRSLTTEQWLKERFRRGYHELKASFSNHKNSNNGMVRVKDSP